MTDVDEPVRARRSRRLRRRHGVVLIIVASLVLGAFGYSAAYYQGWVGQPSTAAASTPRCKSTVVRAPAPATISVNVYNATDESGLATTVAKELKARDFKVVAVANDPLVAVVNGPGEIRYGTRGSDAAQLLARQLPGVDMVEDYRKDATVDFVIGVAYKTLVPAPPKPDPAPSSIRLNVYNTTFRTGLATTVAKEMHRRGFVIGKTANDPLQSMIAGPAEIRYGDDGKASAHVVAKHLPGVKMVDDQRSGTSVDLVLGNGYKALLPVADVPPAPVIKPVPTPTVTHSTC